MTAWKRFPYSTLCVLNSCVHCALRPAYSPWYWVLGTGYRAPKAPLLIAPDDSASRRVVGRQLYVDTITGQDSNVPAPPHLSRSTSEHLETTIDLDSKGCIRKRLNDDPLHPDYIILLSHAAP